MQGYEFAFAVPSWATAALCWVVNIYLAIAILTGCPFCYYPNLRWPADLLRAIAAKGGVYRGK